MDIVLAHELGHAEQFLTSSLGGLSEPRANDAENDYRTERGVTLRKRLSHDGARKVPVAAPPTTTTSTTPTTSCFIVSAAHGSPLAPDVVALRALRDNILRK